MCNPPGSTWSANVFSSSSGHEPSHCDTRLMRLPHAGFHRYRSPSLSWAKTWPSLQLVPHWYMYNYVGIYIHLHHIHIHYTSTLYIIHYALYMYIYIWVCILTWPWCIYFYVSNIAKKKVRRRWRPGCHNPCPGRLSVSPWSGPNDGSDHITNIHGTLW